jgi:hypothetical protein
MSESLPVKFTNDQGQRVILRLQGTCRLVAGLLPLELEQKFQERGYICPEVLPYRSPPLKGHVQTLTSELVYEVVTPSAHHEPLD